MLSLLCVRTPFIGTQPNRTELSITFSFGARHLRPVSTEIPKTWVHRAMLGGRDGEDLHGCRRDAAGRGALVFRSSIFCVQNEGETAQMELVGSLPYVLGSCSRLPGIGSTTCKPGLEFVSSKQFISPVILVIFRRHG